MAKRATPKRRPTSLSLPKLETLLLKFAAQGAELQADAEQKAARIKILEATVAKLETRIYALEESVSLKKVREGLTNDQRIMQANPHIALAL